MIQFKVQNAKAILYSVFFNISFISFINHLYRWYRSWLLIANDNLCFIYFKKKKKKEKKILSSFKGVRRPSILTNDSSDRLVFLKMGRKKEKNNNDEILHSIITTGVQA